VTGQGDPMTQGSRVRAIPEATVARLAGYLGVLTTQLRSESIVSSEKLAVLAGVNPAKLRKDLSFLGTHGTRGVGYDVAVLIAQIERTLGTHETHPVALVGVGHLGSALAGYSGFSGRGFPISALFDSDPRKVGTVVAGRTVAHIDEAHDVCRAASITIGVIATPAGSAQRVADVLVGAGVRSILNFAPARLAVPGDVEVRRMDVALELQMLAFHETRRAGSYPDLAATS
jgi:redox-sensing transcriptional repressor